MTVTRRIRPESNHCGNESGNDFGQGAEGKKRRFPLFLKPFREPSRREYGSIGKNRQPESRFCSSFRCAVPIARGCKLKGAIGYSETQSNC